MAGTRKKYSEDEHSILYAETGGTCPLCNDPILFKKLNSATPTKSYEVAHIYPLKPTPAQKTTLLGHPVPAEINALENVIALCPTCHTKYDKRMQIDEYLKIKEIKTGFLNDARAKQSISKYTLQDEVYEIIDMISALSIPDGPPVQLEFDISTIDNKLKSGMSPLQKREIKMNAVDYYIRIRDRIRTMEQMDQSSVLIIQRQINLYYLVMQKDHPENKDLVFNYIAQWISAKTGGSLLAAKILASFFVQNCEIFDASTN